jgi:hypothetical protein
MRVTCYHDVRADLDQETQLLYRVPVAPSGRQKDLER